MRDSFSLFHSSFPWNSRDTCQGPERVKKVLKGKLGKFRNDLHPLLVFLLQSPASRHQGLADFVGENRGEEDRVPHSDLYLLSPSSAVATHYFCYLFLSCTFSTNSSS